MINRLLGLLTVFSAKKSFSLPIIGSSILNRLGLHLFRMKLSDIVLRIRRFQVSGLSTPKEYKQFKQDGILVLDNVLTQHAFSQLLKEVQKTVDDVDSKTPIQHYGEKGFGCKHKHQWGFDRYDGGTLNRFYAISENQTQATAFTNNHLLIKLTTWLAGTYHNPSKYYLYKLLHGNQTINGDSQKQIHRDTFHSSIKLWYFLEDVKPEHGPFHYAPGTHRLSFNRLRWEYQHSLKASTENKGGAFRVSNDELEQLNDGTLVSYPVKANTLVIADIRGFHCRGAAIENKSRLSIYANIRPAPFMPAYNAQSLARMFNKCKRCLSLGFDRPKDKK